MTPSEQEYRTIGLTKGLSALVDASDYEWLSQWKWWVFNVTKSGTPYAVRSVLRGGKMVRIYMHRVILGFDYSDGLIGDHANGNTLDNRRSNLRKATRTENNRNCGKGKRGSVPYKGVSIYGPRKEWNAVRFRATIKANGKQKSLGYYLTAEEAHAAYCAAAKELHGEFARFQ